ncbi:hypothetical protein GCM10009624_25840 [Gordonia sinesedis]
MLVVLVLAELVITVAATWTYVSARGRVVEVADVTPGSTALVLGSLVADGEPGEYVQGRLDTAVRLYRSGRVTRIVDSGNGTPAAGNEPSVMRAYLMRHGVPAAAIVDDPAGFDTERSCRRARDVYGVRRPVIVTQDFHLDRAIALCRRFGLDATGVAADCACRWWTLARNHFREGVLARPRALLSAVLSAG